MKKVNFLLAEIHDFTSEEAQQLLHNKFVVVLGDSNYRAIYKDLVYFLQTDKMIPTAELKDRHEKTFANDQLVELREERGNDYRLVRQYRTRHHLVRFYFLTRVYSSYAESILNDFRADLKAGLVPDVVILHSCLWDLNRYHDEFPTEPPVPKAIREYRQNAEKFFQALDEVLPPSTLIIWNTAMAIAEDARGYIIEQPCKVSAQDMIEANFYSASLAREFWFDVLDLHYHFRFLQDFHSPEGIHWNFRAHRYLTKLLLTHLAEAWQVQLQKERPQMGIKIKKSPKTESRQFSSPWRNVDPVSPQLIPTLWTNGSAWNVSSSRRSYFHHRRNAHYKKRLRGRLGRGHHWPVQLCGPDDGLHHEHNLLPSAGFPDPRNFPAGLVRRPISSSEGPQPILGYYPPPAPECRSYGRWPIGSSEQEHHPQPNPDYSWTPDSFYGCSRPIQFLEQDGQFYPGPSVPFFEDDFADQGSRFYPDNPPHFPQGVVDASRPLSIVEQEQHLQSSPHNYLQAAHGPDYDSGVMSLPEEARWSPLHPRRGLPVHHNVRNGPWSTDGDEGELGFPVPAEEIHPSGFFEPESFSRLEGWAPYNLPRRIHRGAWIGSRKMLSTRPRRANHRRRACAPYATNRKRSNDSY